MTPDMLTILIPASEWLSANDRRHWAEKARRTKALRTRGFVIARASGLRGLGSTLVTAEVGYPRAGRADPANAAPTVKALLDGLVDAGVWRDDDSEHVVGPHFIRGPKSPTGHTVTFRFTDQEVAW